MTEVVPVFVEISLAGLGLACTILSGAFMILWNSITKLRDDVKADIDAKAGEHRQGQAQLWSELRLAEVRANEYRARVEGRLGQLATREDMKTAREEMRQDLKAMEDRIVAKYRGDAHRD